MDIDDPTPDKSAGSTARWILVFLSLVGALLVVGSFALEETRVSDFVRTILRELGIVLFAVFTVSLLYELFIAEKHANTVLTLVRNQMNQGESNAAACARLGIHKIFVTRDIFEREYPLTKLVPLLVAESKLRVVAQTLLFLMSKSEDIKRAIRQGARIELCLFDPEIPDNFADSHPNLIKSDIQSAISIFKKQIADWVKTDFPIGEVELRYHQILIYDSFLELHSPTKSLAAWDISFGRSVSDKRVFIVNPLRSLGLDLSKRYDFVWESAEVIFRYSGKHEGVNVTVDKLPPIPGGPAPA